MDGVEIVRDDRDMDIITGVACLMAVYFVYGIENPKGLKNTLLFVEKYLCNMEPETKIPTTLIHVHNSLV